MTSFGLFHLHYFAQNTSQKLLKLLTLLPFYHFTISSLLEMLYFHIYKVMNPTKLTNLASWPEFGSAPPQFFFWAACCLNIMALSVSLRLFVKKKN